MHTEDTPAVGLARHAGSMHPTSRGQITSVKLGCHATSHARFRRLRSSYCVGRRSAALRARRPAPILSRGGVGLNHPGC